MKLRRSRPALLILTLIGTSAIAGEAPEGPDLGQAAGARMIADWDTDIMPDGAGLPEGRGTARDGAALYRTHCISCHGEGGLGDSGDQLAGARMSLTGEWPEKTIGTFWPWATTLFDFIRRAKPPQSPGSLSNDEVYALTAYLLSLNGIVGADEEMNAEMLPRVKMPNRDGFIDAWAREKAATRR
ncbi:MAG: cytochrome c [Gammaproteobacteria bacterium]|nr:cytochrome c [Gammaproteobacteria bacterium]